MKILTIEQIRQCDAYTISHEPIASADLMEKAAQTAVEKLKQLFPPSTRLLIFCGTGNNGGDGLAMTRLLLDAGYRVHAIFLAYSHNISEDCQHQLKTLQEQYGQQIEMVENKGKLPKQIEEDVVVDAILGSGLNKAVEDDLLVHAIKLINGSKAFVFSVDVPSGFFAQLPMKDQQLAVHADFTWTFGSPKIGFLLPENYLFVGQWEYADIGLDKSFIAQIPCRNFLIEPSDAFSLRPIRKKYDHKGVFGHGLLIAGSVSMMGAAVLAAKAALRSGIGKITVHCPKIGYTILQTTLPEAMCLCDEQQEYFSQVSFSQIGKYDAVAIGPGLGTKKESADGVKKLIGDYGRPIVFDADAINILSMNRTWLEFLPQQCVFTPHVKEFERLVGKWDNSYQRLEKQIAFSQRYHAVVVFKGAHTCISLPNGTCWFNANGNPAMATAGSGDVLTGIILSLLSQGLSSADAAILGVYLHAASGDKAIENQSEMSLLASDIVENLKYV